VLKPQQKVRSFEVNRKYQSFLLFVNTSSVRMCRVTVSVLSGSVIFGRWQLLVQTVGWRGITDKEGRERKRAFK